jgi:hypothetical protein
LRADGSEANIEPPELVRRSFDRAKQVLTSAAPIPQTTTSVTDLAAAGAVG